jgi:hypothetical protein
MISTAVVLDIIGIIPVAHWVVDIGYVIIFPLWFSSSGASYFKGMDKSSLKWTIFTFLLELIPVLADVLPALTVSIIRNVWHVQNQDKKAMLAYEASQANSRATTLEQNRLRYTGEEPTQKQRSIPTGGVVKRIGNKVDSARKAA